MKALTIHGLRDLRYENVPDAKIQHPADILVQAKLCGICGSDLHIYSGMFTPPGVQATTPAYCIGHEAVGEVCEVGSAVRFHKVGDQVLLPAMIGCGACQYCVLGEIKKCQNGGMKVFGIGGELGGCQSEAIRVPAADVNAVRTPEGVSADQGLLLTDNLATAYGAVLGADFRPGRSVAVIGLGPIGLMALELAIAMGARAAYAIDLVDERRQRAVDMGAIALSGDSIAADVQTLTKGRMIDCVIEAAGADRAMALAFDIVGIAGNISVLSVNASMKLDVPMLTRLNGLTLRVNYATEVHRHWPDLVSLLLSGRIRPERFITRRAALSEGVHAYEELEARAPGALKTILVPG